MKKHLSTILITLIFIIGVSLLLYPTVSNLYNQFHQSRVIANYVDEVDDLNKDDYSIIEINDNPGYSINEWPYEGKGQKIGLSILKLLKLEQTNNKISV